MDKPSEILILDSVLREFDLSLVIVLVKMVNSVYHLYFKNTCVCQHALYQETEEICTCSASSLVIMFVGSSSNKLTDFSFLENSSGVGFVYFAVLKPKSYCII